MKLKLVFCIALTALAGVTACGGDDGKGDQNGDNDTTTDDGTVVAECDKSANAAHIAELTAAQPTIGVRSKTTLTTTTTFASLADDPSTQCSVTLEFRDANGNNTLDAYENWGLTAAERAADLLARMTLEQKLGLMAHATITDLPATGSTSPSAATQSMIAGNVRFGLVSAAYNQTAANRATWANSVQEAAEATAHGIPFVLSLTASHSAGNGRNRARGFSQWPHELGLAASASAAVVEGFGKVAAQEYRAIGVRLALSPSADLFTDPRWYQGQFTFGEDSAQVSELVAAYIKGFQGETLDRNSVAAIASQFPGAGATIDGADARLAASKYLTYPGNNIAAHLAPFAAAFDAGVAGIVPTYGILQTGAWSALDGTLDGTTIEQVGASFNSAVITDALRGTYAFGGLVIAPSGVLVDEGTSPFGAPWGFEESTGAQRVAAAVNAGVDQFAGVDDTTLFAEAHTAGSITTAQVDAAATRALVLMFTLGLFDNPYVDAAQAPALVGADDSYQSGLAAMDGAMVLLLNDNKPANWLNGDGDGTQTADKGNAGNGSGKVLPAPPGEPYVAAGCTYYIMGDFDLDYVASVSNGYGTMTNGATSINDVPTPDVPSKIANSDYVFVRIAAPFTTSADPTAAALGIPTDNLAYAGADNSDALADLETARNAIDALEGSRAQLIVGVDSGRASLVDEILAYDPSGLYIEWSVTDKIFLDVAFGIVDTVGKLPVALPASADAAATQNEDVPGDGAHATYVEGYGLTATAF